MKRLILALAVGFCTLGVAGIASAHPPRWEPIRVYRPAPVIVQPACPTIVAPACETIVRPAYHYHPYHYHYWGHHHR
jgi:hypothetical protein